jgi:pectate lyase
LIGFATLNRDGRNGTNGGAGGPTVVVSSFAALRDAVADNAPRIVQISGTINAEGGVKMINVGSNKSIHGIGATAKLVGFGLDVSGWTPAVRAANGNTECTPDKAANFNHVNNVIIRNLTFDAYADDGVQVSCYSHHVWVDHNTFNKGTDGAADVKRGSDWVTISWNHFVGTDKTMLLGHNDDNGLQDRGRLHVTYHHNWLDRSISRHPRVRFGQAHVYNNYANQVQSYIVGLGVECDIFADGNYIDYVNVVGKGYGGTVFTWDATNYAVEVDDPIVQTGTAFNPRSYYSYTLDPGVNIPTIVSQSAGAGKIVP